MAARQDNDRARDGAVSLLVMPCPACGAALRLADAGTPGGRHHEFECPKCGARLVLAARY